MGIDESSKPSWPRCRRRGQPDAPLRAMIIDSWFDNYVGVVMLVRVVDGELKKGERFKMMATGAAYEANNWACSPRQRAARALKAGEVGFIIAGIKELKAAKVGDTITLERSCPTTWARRQALPGFKEVSRRCLPACTRPRPTSTTSCAMRWKSCSSTTRRCASSPRSQALGFGFRCGFLGLLHMEIVQERLEREFDQDLITTAPSVVYRWRRATAR
jgi:GTP-binding protein LepA